jgi:hypothetical protein
MLPADVSGVFALCAEVRECRRYESWQRSQAPRCAACAGCRIESRLVV